MMIECPCREGTPIGGVPFGRAADMRAAWGDTSLCPQLIWCNQLAGWSLLLVAGVRSVNLLQVLPGLNCSRQVYRSCD